MEFEAKPRVHKRVWLMFQKSMGILVGGNHTSSSSIKNLCLVPLFVVESERKMNLKALSCQILSGSIARRVLLRAFMLASAFSIIPLLQILSGSDPGLLLDSMRYNGCDLPIMFVGSNLLKNRFLKPIWGSIDCKDDGNVTTNVARELMRFVDACGAQKHPFFSLKHNRMVYELEYAENSFDFVFSGDLDKVSVPAIVVLEIERVLKPGGIGAILVGVNSFNTNSLIRSAMPVSSLLKNSNIVHVGYVNEFTLVVFKKRIYSVGYFQQYQLPADCPSIMNNRPHLENLEPLTESKQGEEHEKSIAYLPKFIDFPSRKQLVYVEIGGGEHMNSSVSSWFLPSYPADHSIFNVFFVDHNTSVLLSCAKKPGVTFIYYPGLAGDEATLNPDVEEFDPSMGDEGFDFLGWFGETVQHADFVVLKMKAGEVELKFLSGLFKSGAICFIDELFLSCSDQDDEKGRVKGDCMDLFKSLRSSGVYVHQWWGD
ncbi:PEPTIDE UPSTREAM PROTEIN [Salix purpurea]|uniref:PEPTIDE UPSTREAM PROTEIN n=1 Tax=Salix purpurea TaxID=77065 RepID=A0A9Q0Q391_SALPP|nr:PEPTIDE UPSTREAM PROTEIN [Salix purpurea]